MSDNRDAQALDYDPNYNKTEYVKDYKDIKAKGKREGHPDVQPHHIRGLNNYHYAWKHLHPDNRSKLQTELRPYGLQFGNDKSNLVAAEGQWSKSKPGETRYGGQHGQLHSEQESAMQNELSVDRFKGSYRGVSGVTWSEMSQEQIMDFLRSMAVKDEMVTNRTLSTALPLPSTLGLPQVQIPKFVNRLMNRVEDGKYLFEQGKSGSELDVAVNNAAKVIPGLKANPETDLGKRVGDAIGNEIEYAAKSITGFANRLIAPLGL